MWEALNGCCVVAYGGSVSRNLFQQLINTTLCPAFLRKFVCQPLLCTVMLTRTWPARPRTSFKAKDTKIVLKDSLRTRPRTNITGCVSFKYKLFYQNLVLVAEYHVDCSQTLQWRISGATNRNKCKRTVRWKIVFVIIMRKDSLF